MSKIATPPHVGKDLPHSGYVCQVCGTEGTDR